MLASTVYVGCDWNRIAWIAAIANSLRRSAGVRDDEQFDVLRALEFDIQRFVPEFEFVIESDELFDSAILAAARLEPPEIIARESVYLDAMNGQHGAKFVLAHELGHLLLSHRGVDLTFSAPSSAAIKASETESSRHFEWEANEFAAELLMPSEHAKNFSARSVVRIAEQYCVSFRFALERLRILESRKKSWADFVKFRGWLEFLDHSRLTKSGNEDQYDPGAPLIFEKFNTFSFADLGDLTYGKVRTSSS